MASLCICQNICDFKFVPKCLPTVNAYNMSILVGFRQRSGGQRLNISIITSNCSKYKTFTHVECFYFVFVKTSFDQRLHETHLLFYKISFTVQVIQCTRTTVVYHIVSCACLVMGMQKLFH